MSFGSRLDAHNERLKKNEAMIARVENCTNNCNDCNDWEVDFLENILEWLMQGRELSAAQIDKLEQIEHIVEWGRDYE